MVPSGTAPRRAGRFAALLPLTAFAALWMPPGDSRYDLGDRPA